MTGRPRAQDVDRHVGARLRELRVAAGPVAAGARRPDRRDLPAGSQVRNGV